MHKGIKYILAQENNCIVENHCITKKQLQCPISSLNLPFTANYFDSLWHRLSAAGKVLRVKKGIFFIKERVYL